MLNICNNKQHKIYALPFIVVNSSNKNALIQIPENDYVLNSY